LQNTEQTKVVNAASVVGLATMLSRVFGFLRDVVVAAFFGTSAAADAFFVAFRIPNLLRRLLGEGSLTVAFVPVFTQYLTQKSKAEAAELANVVFTILSIILVFVSLIGIIFSPWIVLAMAPGFADTPDQFALAVYLNRIMFPYIFFISLVALCMGILNSLRHFAAPALSPVTLNISMIAATFLLYPYFAEPIFALAIGVMLGGVIQLAMQWPFLVKMGIRLKPNFNFRHPGLRQIGLLLIPTLIGSGIYQINILVGTILASLLPKGSVSYLYYADRIVELPLGIFAIAIGTAALPSLSEQVARGSFDEMKKTISFSLRLILFVSIPATIALIILREPIVSVLFQRGAFQASATIATAQALFFYAIGLWAFSVIRVIDAAFFALQDRKSPLRAGFIALIINVVMGIILMIPLKHGGLALATSIATSVNVLILSIILWKKIGPFLDEEFFNSLKKVFIASLVMAAAIYAVRFVINWNIHDVPLNKCFYLFSCIIVGCVAFFTASFMAKNQDLFLLWKHLRKKPH